MTIGDRLKRERARLKKTQEGMAALGGVGLTAYKNYERGIREPDAGFLTSIANAGVDVQYVITGTASATVISAEERVLLDGFRALDDTTRRRMLAFVLGGELASKPNKAVTVTANGGQAAGRDIKNTGGKHDRQNTSRSGASRRA